MHIINPVNDKEECSFIASSKVDTFDSTKMIKRLCKHFSHKINTKWDGNHGEIYFAMGFCELQGDVSFLTLRCGANNLNDLTEVTDCIDSHVLRFSKKTIKSTQWGITNVHDK